MHQNVSTGHSFYGKDHILFQPGRLLPFMVLLILCLAGPGWGEPRMSVPDRLAMPDAIQIAVQNNPRVAAALATVSASEARLVQARSGFYPQVRALGTAARTNSPLWAFGTTLNQGRITSEDFDPSRLNHPDAVDNYGVGLAAVWPIFDSGQTLYSVRQAKLGESAAELTVARTAQEIIARTVEAYAGVLLAEARLAVLDQALATAGENRKMVKSRYDSGFVVKSDFLQTEVHLADLTRQRLSAESDVAVNRAELCAAMGLDTDSGFGIAGSLAAGAPEGELFQWLSTAQTERPDLKAVSLQESMAEAEVQKARASRLPSVALAADYGTNREDMDNGEESYTVGAQVSVPLFSGFRTSGKVAEAAANLRQLRAGKNALVQGIGVEVRRAYFQTKSSREGIRVAESAVAQAEEALRIVQNRYNSGLVTLVELQNAELSLLRARTGFLSAGYDHTRARADLMLAAGVLDVDFR